MKLNLMKVKVLQHHIEQGQPGKSMSCAIALALLEQFPEAEIFVRLDRAFIDSIAWLYSGDAPEQFIKSFDAGLPVSPFEFEMEQFQYPGVPFP